MAIVLDEKLRERIEPWAKQRGFDSEDAFAEWAIEEKVRELQIQFANETTVRVRAALEAKGITEEEIMEDLERFCRELPDPDRR